MVASQSTRLGGATPITDPSNPGTEGRQSTQTRHRTTRACEPTALLRALQSTATARLPMQHHVQRPLSTQLSGRRRSASRFFDNLYVDLAPLLACRRSGTAEAPCPSVALQWAVPRQSAREDARREARSRLRPTTPNCSAKDAHLGQSHLCTGRLWLRLHTQHARARGGGRG